MADVQRDPGPASVSPGRFSAITSTGRIYFWEGGSLWLGEGKGTTQWHEHHAHQLAIALEGCFRFRTDADGPWTTFQAAIVPSHLHAQFELDGATMAHLFVEPESRPGRTLTQRFGSGAVAELPHAAPVPLPNCCKACCARPPRRMTWSTRRSRRSLH
jgi:hypothetical protein